jgi:predicted kinase
MKEKTLFIVRGIPGAGKSTFAKSIGATFFEADMFHMEGNLYKFDIKKIKEAHSWCQNQVRISMKNADSKMGDYKIAVANTFTQEWEMEPYFEMAKEFGFKVFTLIIENRHGGVNQHNVPEETIEFMKNRFEIKL